MSNDELESKKVTPRYGEIVNVGCTASGAVLVVCSLLILFISSLPAVAEGMHGQVNNDWRTLQSVLGTVSAPGTAKP